jgi:hypothetical protein
VFTYRPMFERSRKVRIEGPAYPMESSCLAAWPSSARVSQRGFLEGTGIMLNEGVVVDPHMATSIPSIYAAGT